MDYAIYLKGPTNISFAYGSNTLINGLTSYIDSDDVSEKDHVGEMEFTSCYIFTLFGCAISWRSTLLDKVYIFKR